MVFVYPSTEIERPVTIRTRTVSNTITFNQDTFGQNDLSIYSYDDITLTQITTFTIQDGVTTVLLRNPIFGNTETINYFRALNRTPSGQYLTYRDDQWPVTKTLKFEFEGISEAIAESFIAFMKTRLAKSITIIDQESRTWNGVIIQPEVNAIVDQGKLCRYNLSLVFMGKPTTP